MEVGAKDHAMLVPAVTLVTAVGIATRTAAAASAATAIEVYVDIATEV